MNVIWLRAASIALDRHYELLAARSPKAARLVFRRIVAITNRCREFPHTDRPGQFEGVRQLVVPGAPYVIIYRLSAHSVQVLRVFSCGHEP
jgi:toxin ParE1/3/4